jgi:hypothetical protein
MRLGFAKRRWAGGLLAAALLLTPAAAAAQGSDQDRAAAQTLFEAAKRFKQQKKWEQACEKFAASQKLDPAVGTQLNLADCYEQIGKTASAWVNFVEVSELAEAGRRRAKFAKQRADKLRPKLTKLVITVADPVEGMDVQRGSDTVSREMWGTAVPVDPGEHVIRVSAPGKRDFSESIEVAGEGEEVSFEVPPLRDAPIDSPDPTTGPDDGAADEDGSGQFVAGAIIGGVGLVGLGMGVAFAAVAHGKEGDSEAFCRPTAPNQCTAPGVELRDEAQTAQAIYVASFVVGGAATIAGVVMMLTAAGGDDDEAPPADDTSAGPSLKFLPLAGPDFAGVSLRGAF